MTLTALSWLVSVGNKIALRSHKTIYMNRDVTNYTLN